MNEERPSGECSNREKNGVPVTCTCSNMSLRKSGSYSSERLENTTEINDRSIDFAKFWGF